MKSLLAFGTIALALGACSPNQKAETSSASTKPSIQEVFSISKTLNGTPLKYLAAKPELSLYRFEIPSGGKIPLHTHPAPMMVYLQGARSGSLLNTRVQPDGTEIETEFKPGEAFIKGVNEPHYVENVGEDPTIVWMIVASIEDMPQSSLNESI